MNIVRQTFESHFTFFYTLIHGKFHSDGDLHLFLISHDVEIANEFSFDGEKIDDRWCHIQFNDLFVRINLH